MSGRLLNSTPQCICTAIEFVNIGAPHVLLQCVVGVHEAETDNYDEAYSTIFFFNF